MEPDPWGPRDARMKPTAEAATTPSAPATTGWNAAGCATGAPHGRLRHTGQTAAEPGSWSSQRLQACTSASPNGVALSVLLHTLVGTALSRRGCGGPEPSLGAGYRCADAPHARATDRERPPAPISRNVVWPRVVDGGPHRARCGGQLHLRQHGGPHAWQLRARLHAAEATDVSGNARRSRPWRAGPRSSAG